jgi:hypothetical protein
MTQFRNGFDHAWTGKKKAFINIEEKSFVFLNQIKEVLSMLQEHKIL